MWPFDLFRSKEQAEPLVELPQPDTPIEFDEEEQRAMRLGWPSTLRDTGEVILFTEDGTVAYEGREADAFRRTMASGGLQNLARQRFERGELKGAASMCVKAIGLCPDECNAWLLLAQLHAASGDFERAKRLLREAERAARRIGLSLKSPLWKPSVDRLRAQIKSRRYTALPSAGRSASD